MKTWQKLQKNPKLWDKFFLREEIVRLIRKFFYQNGFHEVETPILVPYLIPESYLDIFQTQLNSQDKIKDLYLTTSPESSLKKLLVAGIGNCFEITKSFRNHDLNTPKHNPEFTLLEWYRTGSTYQKIMEDCEKLFLFLINNLHIKFSKFDNKSIVYQGLTVNFSEGWEKITVSEALKKYLNVSLTDLIDDLEKPYTTTVKISNFASQKLGYNVSKRNSWEEIFDQMFLNAIEKHLGSYGRPTIIYEYPSVLAGLARIKKTKSYLAERFEVYIAGLELADCYHELTDFKEQKRRFAKEEEIIRKKYLEVQRCDRDFLQALKIGLAPCSGIALGIDRLVMLFLDSGNIDDTMLFPMREMLADYD